MAYSSYARRPPASRKFKRWLVILLPVLLLGIGTYWYLNRNNNQDQPTPSIADTEETQNEETPAYVSPDLQPTIDAWIAKQRADYHIQVYDLQSNEVVGEHEPDTPLFAASLYKIFIAYLSYKDFQSGTQDPNEVILAGQTRLECVDKMIRSSDSPCGETLMADLGQQTLNKRVVDELGTTATIFNGIETSASDSIKVLKFIHSKKFLTDEYYSKLMDSMLIQDAKYRRGLAAGAPEATWHTKVGWNLDINYHDIGFMTMPDGRVFAVAILGQGSGSPAPIADFAKTIYAALTR